MGSLLEEQRLSERGQPFLIFRGYHQNTLAWDSKSLILQILGGKRLPGPKAFSPSQEILAGLCCGLFRWLQTVGSSWSRFVSRGKCVPFRLPYARRGEERTILQSAGGGNAHVRLSVSRRAVLAPTKPTLGLLGPVLYSSGSLHKGRTYHLQELGNGRAPSLPLGSIGLAGSACVSLPPQSSSASDRP